MLLLLACGRFGYETIDRPDLLVDAGGSATGGMSNTAGEGGFVGIGAAAGTGGAGGSCAGGSAAGSSNTADPCAGDAGVDAGSHPNVDAGLGTGGCASDVPLRRRPEGEPPAVVDGNYDMPNAGWSRLARNTQWLTLRGQGYFALRWEIEYATIAGRIDPPTVTPTGTLLRVGGGGGYSLDDPQPGTSGTYLGNQEQGISFMAPGVETPWHLDFYYLDGEMTLVLNETSGLLNLEVQSQLYSQLVTPGSGVYSPGVVCDPE
jgi:hypothetical protein